MFSSRRLTVNGVETFVYDVSSGEVPVICLHGNPDSADAGEPLLARSAELGRVIAPDLTCFGRSARPDAGVFDGSFDAYVEWVAAFVDALGVDRYWLVVHDWGSIALAAASHRTNRSSGSLPLTWSRSRRTTGGTGSHACSGGPASSARWA